MLGSLRKLSRLPVRTQIFCGHEYTVKNTEFALRYEERNEVLKQKYRDALKTTEKGVPTVPGSLEEELLTNPFLRCQQAEIKRALGLSEAASELEVFTKLREERNKF